MRWQPIGLAMLLGLGGFLGEACGGSSGSGPPDIAYGRDLCDECHMIINEARFAAAYRTEDGEARIFDDVGDMVVNLVAAGESRDLGPHSGGERAWVHDYESEEWLTASEARYVRGEIETPMGRGVVAFAKNEAAQEFADEIGGDVMGWDAVVELALDGDLEPDRAIDGMGSG